MIREQGQFSIRGFFTTRPSNRRLSHGFSLIEMMIVITILMVGGAMAYMGLRPVFQDYRVTNGYDTVLMMMRRGREAAINERRQYLVTFLAPRTMTLTQMIPGGGAGPVIATLTLPSDIQFDAETGLPNNATYDNFGTGKFPIDFNQGVGGQGTTVYFYPDGSAHDINGNLNNGVVYIARQGDLYSSRAITLWGTTGRIRGYRLYQNQAAGTNYWGQQ
jgi:prepilin-type N-terminal cleavage/methylation domain-containing protein